MAFAWLLVPHQNRSAATLIMKSKNKSLVTICILLFHLGLLYCVFEQLAPEQNKPTTHQTTQHDTPWTTAIDKDRHFQVCGAASGFPGAALSFRLLRTAIAKNNMSHPDKLRMAHVCRSPFIAAVEKFVFCVFTAKRPCALPRFELHGRK